MTGEDRRYDVREEADRAAGMSAAGWAIRRGELVIVPTDTVYGIAADAFDPGAVKALLKAKGRGRAMPPPVLVSAATTVEALVDRPAEYVQRLVDEFWPGPLTLVCHQQPSLHWDLGETRGTVAVRMPDHEVTRELIIEVGPLAVSSANRTGMPPATNADDAAAMLGERVSVILDAGPCPGEVASTILDCTGERPRLLRDGALPLARIRDLLGPELSGELAEDGDPEAAAGGGPGSGA